MASYFTSLGSKTAYGGKCEGTEVSWSEEGKLRSELAALRGDLEEYAKALAIIAGVEE